MSFIDHPSQKWFSRTPIRPCADIGDHEPHHVWDDMGYANIVPPSSLCGGVPRKVIDLNEARIRRERG